jgi:hypothetical protein
MRARGACIEITEGGLTMRAPIATSTFVGLAGAAVAVGATTQVMQGSDSLYDLMTDSSGVLIGCVVNGMPLSSSPASSTSLINYIGGGSALGETELEETSAPSQHVYPSSAFLSRSSHVNNICNVKEPGTTAATAEGINFALDGIALLAQIATGGSESCNGVAADCSPTTDPGKGLAFDRSVHDVAKIVPGPNMVLESSASGDDILVGGTQNNLPGDRKRLGIERILAGPNGVVDSVVSGDDVLLPEVTYTFNDWRDVLKVVYAGVDHIGNTKSCASAIRFAVADNYANVFQAGCDTTTTSATTTTVPAPAYEGNGCRQKTWSSSVGIGDGPAELRHALRPDDEAGITDVFLALLGLSKPKSVFEASCFNAFCNAFTGAAPPEDLRSDATILSDAGTANQDKKGAYDWDDQDFDPIRRRCMDSDLVCSRCGTLGLVLPVRSTEFLTQAEAFTLTADGPGGSVIPSSTDNPFLGTGQVSTPAIFHACSGAPARDGGRCPNGEGVNAQTGCQWPSAGPVPISASLAANFNQTDNRPTEIEKRVDGCYIMQVDGRVYNEFVRSSVTGQILKDTKRLGNVTREISGGFYRLHTATQRAGRGQDLPPGGGTQLCTHREATSQVGCLAGNDPCSIAFTSRSSLLAAPGISAVKVSELDPTDSCIQQLVTSPATAYPLSMRLWLNTVAGFESNKLGTSELALAQCISNPTLMNPIVSSHGFVELPGGNPICTDFSNELASECGTAPTDACLGNDTIPLVPNCPNCSRIPGSNTGTVIIDGGVNQCPDISSVSSDPPSGCSIAIHVVANDDGKPNPPGMLTYSWSGRPGLSGANPILHCDSSGLVNLTLTVSDGDPDPACAQTYGLTVLCPAGCR